MSEPLIQNVSDTAFMVAEYRAMETERSDALFRDPFAARLVGDHGAKIVASMPASFLGGWSVSIRTVIIDEFLRTAIARGVDTVLNLGAGLDARPYRMDLPASLRWIEVDYPEVIDLKEARLSDEKPQCRLERVRMDLTDRAARQRLFSRLGTESKEILVLTEGVIPYLRIADVAALADDLHAESTFRSWVVDYFSRESLRYRKRQGLGRALQNAPFLFDPPDWFGLFADHGWRRRDIKYIAEESERLHRKIPLPRLMKALITIGGFFAPKARREAFKKFVGYALLERV